MRLYINKVAGKLNIDLTRKQSNVKKYEEQLHTSPKRFPTMSKACIRLMLLVLHLNKSKHHITSFPEKHSWVCG